MMYLSEISFKEASPEIRQIYINIQICCRTPIIALIYRHLASFDKVLEWAWASLAPIMCSGQLTLAAKEINSSYTLPSIKPFNDIELERLNLLDPDIKAIRYIISGYNAANPCNILAVLLLKELLNEPGHSKNIEKVNFKDLGNNSNEIFPGLPELVEPSKLPDLVLRLRPDSADNEGLVPSLYRHLGHWPEWLEKAAQAKVMPLYQSKEIQRCAKDLEESANEKIIDILPLVRPFNGIYGRPSPKLRDDLSRTMDTFVETIPTLIIIGRILDKTLSKF